MAQRTFSLASLVACQANSRRDRKAEQIRKQRQFLKSTPLDLLEKRQLLATYYVDNTSDNVATTGSLRWAVDQANSNTTDATDAINFNSTLDGATITLTVANGPITINDTSGGNLTITGLGQTNLTISGGGTTGIFNVCSTTTINNLSIINANGAGLPYGGAIYNNQTNLTLESVTLANNTGAYGGAILNYGGSTGNATLNITNATLVNNNATNGGGAVYNLGSGGNATLNITNSTLANNTAVNGGAVYNEGSAAGNATLNITNATLANNTADNGGGAIFNNSNSGNATLTVTDSTLTYNNATNGGAVYNDGSDADSNATLNITNSTLVYNNATNSGGAVFNDGGSGGNATLNISRSTVTFNNAATSGGAVFNNGYRGNATVTVNQATIAFNNAANGGGLYDYNNEGHLYLYNSIVGNNTATTGGPDVYGNIAVANYTLFSVIDANTTISPSTGNIVGDPMLGTLGDYGGPTQTIPLLAGSVAIGNASASVIGTKDQRGVVYITADMGSYAYVVTFDVWNANDAGVGSLRDAISLANSSSEDDIITFDPALTGNTITVISPIVIGANTSSGSLTINGLGQANLTISGGDATGVFEILSNTTINNLSIMNANGGGLTAGGAIYNNHSSLTIANINFANNTGDFGGAIYSDGENGSATLTITGSTFTNSIALINGGAISNYGRSGIAILTISNSTFTDSSSLGLGGVIENIGDSGGNATVTVNNSTFSNSSAEFGGAIYSDGTIGNSSLAISNSTFTNSNAVTYGGAIYNSGPSGNSIISMSDSNFTSSNANDSGGAIYSLGDTGDTTITITASNFTDSASANFGGAIYADTSSGNATFNVTNATFTNSTLSNNTASSGGAIYFYGNSSNSTMTLSNTSVTNSTALTGPAIYQYGSAVTLNNSTLGNSVYVDGLGNLTVDDGSVTNPLAIASGNVITVTNYSGPLELGQISASELSVNLTGGAITQATGTNITVSGTANFISSGTGTSGNITLGNTTNNFSTVTASGTNITITDVDLLTLGTIKGNGVIEITASNINITSTVNATTAGSVSLIPTSARVVDFGTKSTGNFGLTPTEISNITAANLTIGSSSAGNITNTSNINFTGNLLLVSNGTITQNDGNLTVSGTANLVSTGNITLNNATNNFNTLTANGANITIGELNNISIGAVTATGDFTVAGNTSASCISVTGPIHAESGTGNVSLTGRNVQVTGNITTAAGDIAIYGNGGGSYQTGSFQGVCITGSSSTVNITSSGGNITLDGRAGTGGTTGVSISKAVISTNNNGALSITGVSGNGSATSAHGIYIELGATNLLTVNGPISLTGTSNSTGSSSVGVKFNNVGTVKASGSGSISITGYSGLSGSGQVGIYIYRNPPASNTVESTSGNITFTGVSRGNSNTSEGIHLELYPGIYASNGGSIFFEGTTANASALAIELNDQGNARGPSIVASNGGAISFTANSFGITGNAVISAGLSGNVNFNSKGAVIDLGGSDTTSNLGLSNAEVNKITANVLTIGNSTASAIVSTGPLSRANATLGTNLTVISGSSITQTGGNLTVTGTANFVSTGTDTNGNITLANSSNDFGTFTANGINVSVTDSTGLILGSVTAGNLTVTANEAVTQTAPANVTGTANFVSTGTGTSGNITLNNAYNIFHSGGCITACGTNITIINSCATTLSTFRANSLTVNATTGNISQPSTTNIVVSGNAIFNSTNTINLTNSTNSFGDLRLNSPQSSMTVNGTLDVGSMQVTNLTVSGTGSLTQQSGTNMVVTGTANFSVTGNLTLNSDTNRMSGPIIVSGNVITIHNQGNTNLTQVMVDELILDSTGGDIRQSGTIVVRNTNTACFTAINGNIILNVTNNDFVGGIYANASNNIEIYNSNATVLGNISSANFQIISAGGNISQVPGTNVTVTGTSNLVATGNSILLIEPNNDFNTLTANATNLTLADSNDITLANTSISNTVNITLANQISISGSYVAPTTLLNNGTLTVASQLQTNLTIATATANIQTGGNITGNAILNSGSLISNGTFGTLTLNGGTLYTSHNGTLVNGALTFNNGSNWSPSGLSLTDFGTISTSGPVTIQPDANLTPIAPGGMLYGEGLTLIDQSGSSAISQANGYYGKPNGTLFTSNNMSLQIYYNGQTGNYTKASSGNDLIVRIATGNISVITPSPTTNANQAFDGNLTFRVMGGTGNTVGVANVPVTVVLPADVDNCNIASGRFEYGNTSNRSVTRYTDSNGNITIPTWANLNPGPFQACLTQTDDSAVYSKPYMGVIGLAVQRQSVNRSFVRYLDVVLSGSDLANITDATAFTNNFTLTKIKTAGYTGGAVASESTPLGNVTKTPVGYTIDFGAKGLGNLPTSTSPDGVYRLANTTSSSITANYTFHRLLGDANGDGVVTAADSTLVQSVQLTRAWRYNDATELKNNDSNANPVATYAWAGDLNGDGRINALDLNIAGRWRGRRVIY